MQIKPRNHSIDSLFAFLLLLTFSLFTLLLAGMGSTIYQNGAAYLDENYTSRTAVAYVAEKIRQHDDSGNIFFTTVEELPALGLRDTIDGESYLTYVYFFDGALRELFIQENREPEAALGNRIVKLASLDIEPVDTTADEATDNAGTNETAGMSETAGDGSSSAGIAAEAANNTGADETHEMGETAGDSSSSTRLHLLRVTAVSENGNELTQLVRISSE